MGPSYRIFYQTKQQEAVDLEARVVSPRSPRTTSSLGALSSRRRRSHNWRTYRFFVACLSAVILLTYVVHNISSSRVQGADKLDTGPIDVVAVSIKPSCVTRQAVASLNRFLQPRTIHVITTSHEKCRIFTSFAPNVACHLQDEFLDGLTLDRVGDFLQTRLGLDQHKHFNGRKLSGWYMQQFLKLGSVMAIPDLSKYYLVWDLDMVLLSPLQLLWPSRELPVNGDNGEGGAIKSLINDRSHVQFETLVNIGGSMSPGYMTSFLRLMKRGMEFAPDGTSFVTHWMVVYKPYLREFLQELSGGGDGPLDWVWHVLGAVDARNADMGFSEYASYISWVRQHFPQSQRLSTRKTWVRHPFGQSTVRLLRLLRADGCCCPNGLLLWLLRALGIVYTGYEVGHIPQCRYNAPEYTVSYGLQPEMV